MEAGKKSEQKFAYTNDKTSTDHLSFLFHQIKDLADSLNCHHQDLKLTKQIKSSLRSLSCAEACNECRGLFSPRLSTWATRARHGGGEPLATVSHLTVTRIKPTTSHADILTE